MNVNKRSTVGVAAIVVISAVLSAGNANAADTGWWGHIGPGLVNFNEKSKLKLGGAPVPGGNATSSDNVAAIIELGYSFNENWSASFTFGYPPTAKVSGAGSISFAGELGKIQYAPAIFAAQYRFSTAGQLVPYIGAGLVNYKVVNTKDAAIKDLELDSTWGSVIQAGFELPVKKDIGIFFDVKKIYVDTYARGSLPAFGGAPVEADVQLDPMVVHAGVVFLF